MDGAEVHRMIETFDFIGYHKGTPTIHSYKPGVHGKLALIYLQLYYFALGQQKKHSKFCL